MVWPGIEIFLVRQILRDERSSWHAEIIQLTHEQIGNAPTLYCWSHYSTIPGCIGAPHTRPFICQSLRVARPQLLMIYPDM